MQEKPRHFWDTNMALIDVYAGQGLDRVARSKGLEPLTF